MLMVSARPALLLCCVSPVLRAGGTDACKCLGRASPCRRRCGDLTFINNAAAYHTCPSQRTGGHPRYTASHAIESLIRASSMRCTLEARRTRLAGAAKAAVTGARATSLAIPARLTPRSQSFWDSSGVGRDSERPILPCPYARRAVKPGRLRSRRSYSGWSGTAVRA